MPPLSRPMRQARCRPCLERLEDRLTPARVLITNAPPNAPEGAAIILGAQFIDNEGIPQPNLPPGTSLFWRVTDDNGLLLGVFRSSSQDPTFPLSSAIALDDGNYRIEMQAVIPNIQVPREVAVITIVNDPPVANAGANQAVLEGDLVFLHGEFFDPGRADAHTLRWEILQNDVLLAAGTGADFQFRPPDNGIYQAIFTVVDDDRGAGVSQVTITADNVAPRVFAGPDQFVTTGSPVSLLGTWTDPGIADTHTPTWLILDANGIVVAAGVGSGITFTPLAAGVFTAVFMVTDDDGDSGRDTATIVVTDPSPEGPTVVILGGTDPLSSDLPPLAPPTEPGLPVALVGTSLTGRPGSGFITPRLDGGNAGATAGNQTLPANVFFPVGSIVTASSAPSATGAPIVTSELSTAGLDPHSERTQSLLRAEASPAPPQRGGGSDDENLLSDHVKTKVLQTVVSPTIEDDSVSIVETLLNNAPASAETATAPQDPGVSFLLPMGEPLVPSGLDAEAAGDDRETSPFRSIAVALLLAAPMLVSIWGDHRRVGSSGAP